MKNTAKTFIIAAFCVVGILLFSFIFYNTYHTSQLTISEVTDIEGFLIEHNISTSYANDIFYYMLSDTSVLILDSRNAEYKLYVHSIVRADMDNNGTLKVVVTDKTAVSESDILGTYAVVIESRNKINNIQITREKER